MSIMHSMVFYFRKKGKRCYSPDTPQDYAAKRDAEVRQNRFVTVPKSALIREMVLGGVGTTQIAVRVRHSVCLSGEYPIYLIFHGTGNAVLHNILFL